MQALGQTQKEVANTDYFGVAVDELFFDDNYHVKRLAAASTGSCGTGK